MAFKMTRFEADGESLRSHETVGCDKKAKKSRRAPISFCYFMVICITKMFEETSEFNESSNSNMYMS